MSWACIAPSGRWSSSPIPSARQRLEVMQVIIEDLSADYQTEPTSWLVEAIG